MSDKLRKAIEEVILKEQSYKPAKATSKASLPMPKKRKIGKFEIGLAFDAPETIYTKSSMSKLGLSNKVSTFNTNTMYKGNQSNKTRSANNLFSLYENILMLFYN